MQNQNEVLEEAPLVSHLTELRTRLIYSFIVFAFAVGGCFYCADTIFIFLLEPLKYALGNDVKVTYWAPHEAFFTYMNLSVYAGIIIAAPFFLLQIWGFIAPGLYSHEKKSFLPFLLMTPIMFTLGIMMAFYIVMPTALQFFAGFQTLSDLGGPQVVQETRVSEYLYFAMSFILAFGLAFELPVGLVLAGKAGLVTAQSLKNKRPYAVMIIFILSAFFTPPDVVSMFSLALPLYLMYELSIIIIKSFQKKSEDSNV